MSEDKGPRAGFTLLEVILALAILGLSAAILGEACRNGISNAMRARDYTHGSILCEGVLNEVASGIIPLENASNVTHPFDPNWIYSINVVSRDTPGLIEVRVIMSRNLPANQHPVTCALVRWIRDATIFDTAAEAAAEASAASSSTSSSGSTSGSSSTSSGT